MWWNFHIFLELIIMLMLKINEIILYKIKFYFLVLFYEIISFLAHNNNYKLLRSNIIILGNKIRVFDPCMLILHNKKLCLFYL